MGAKQRLAIIGAGPKALALASKATVLAKLGFKIPELWIVERSEVASFWDGRHGYTNGRQLLGTSPEKDVGFPYFSHCWGDDFNRRVNIEMLEYSWQTYLVEKNQFSDWIDRGRPPPEHRKWANYLRWVYSKLRNEVTFRVGEVSHLSSKNNQWVIRTHDSTIEADGVVVTGPGTSKAQWNVPDDPRVFTLESFWKNLNKVHNIPENSHIAVVGCGETAASIVLYLGHLRADLTIDLIVPSAMSYSRGESYVENNVYTDPFRSNWISWTLEDRINFIQRTDKGVFSLASKKYLDQWEFVEIIPGYFRSIQVNTGNQLVLEVDYKGEREHRIYDFVALSMGCDSWNQVNSWLDNETLDFLKASLNTHTLSSEWVELQIVEDLSIRGLYPKLHMPMLANLNQGPGFGNLSCLGRLSDQILQSYVSLELTTPF